MIKTPIYRTKTFWTGVGGIVVAAGSYFAGEITQGIAMQMVITSLLGIFVRDGISRELGR